MAYISSDVTESFIAEVSELLQSVDKQSSILKNAADNKEALTELLRALHTIKGNSRMLGFYTVEKLAHAVEDIYKSVKDGKVKSTDRLVRLVYHVSEKMQDCLYQIKKSGTDEQSVELYLVYCDKVACGEIIDIEVLDEEIRKEKQDAILLDDDEEENDSITDVQSIRIKLKRINDVITSFDDLITREFRLKHQLDLLREIEEKTNNSEISKIRKQFTTDIEALESCIFNVQQQVFDLRMLPLSMVLHPLKRNISLESMQLGKDIQCIIPETDVALDKIILEQLNDILMHLVRNALDHGIESPEERKAAGKCETGTISITCVQETKHIELTVFDDGRGIDFEKIRSKAIVQFPEKAEDIKQMGEKELASFLFMTGFSTKDKVTELSGRGVGLDVVWANMEKIKGRIRVESTKGEGTWFILRFPLSLATLQGLFIYSNDQKFLIPVQHLVDITYKKRNEYISLQNQSYIKLNNELIPVFSLSSLFDKQKTVMKLDADTILIAEYMEQKIGIIVEEVQRYVSLVVKPLPKAFCNFSILQGIVFDEHYAIVPILYVPEIITKFKTLRGYDIKKYEAKTKKRSYSILVVDDSDTTRQIESSILENAGFLVETAVDGIDGLEKIKKKQFDLIISDRDMPRMDGEVFLDNIRRLNNYINIPVIIVSAIQDPKIQERFKAAGANAFITKADFKRGNLISTVEELLNG